MYFVCVGQGKERGALGGHSLTQNGMYPKSGKIYFDFVFFLSFLDSCVEKKKKNQRC